MLTFGQNLPSPTEMWTDVEEAAIPKVGTRYILPTTYRTSKLDVAKLQMILDVAPMERTPVALATQTLLALPMPDGSMELFNINESPIMAPELAEQFPQINTYNGVSVSDPGKYVRFDLTPKGFHAMILVAGESTIFIDPYSFGGGDDEHYIVYRRKDFRPAFDKNFDCATEDKFQQIENKAKNEFKAAFGTCELREYRLALACTGEYTQFHGGTVAGALAAQVTTMNRVNGIYETAMAIRMNIVANNNLIVYTNATTDPYTNNNGGAMLGQNQTTCDNIIGSANYDIGHVFSTGGGGIAGLGVVCSNGSKAQGVTGGGSPVGDPFDVDYVAHEMGHQFGANHTQNNACNRNPSTAMEPGSASTIMGYAGICAPNVQNNSDDHFHGVSLEEIEAEILSHNCPVTTTLTNTAPTVSTSALTYNVPANTAFALTAVATDPDPDVLTYCWEQMDNQVSTQPPVASSTGGPNFRSNSPITDPTRYFPNLIDLAAGVSPTWEVLPSVSRAMNFRVTVRDNAAGAGCTDHEDVVLNFDANSGPFIVTYPNATGIVWTATTSETVTWDVAGTDLAPVSCTTVDILLSTDGGQTYPTVLATAVANDGSEAVTVPNTPSTTCRIMVRANDGIFFDISDNDFEIQVATFAYDLDAVEDVVGLCPTGTANFEILVGSLLGYTDSVDLTVSGVPSGANASFSVNPVYPADTSVLTISNLSGVTAGSYNLTINANSTSGPQTYALELQVYDPNLPAVTLSSPADGAQGVVTPASLAWGAAATGGVEYSIEIATDMAFTNIVETASNLTTNTYTATNLQNDVTYYWRVTASNPCTTAASSAVFSFSTPICSLYTSTDVPQTIPTSVGSINSSLNIPVAANIIDLDVVDLSGTHSWINDLSFTLTSPSSTTATLFSRICDDEDNFDLNFDDAANPGALPCPPVGGGTYQAEDALSVFNGENTFGDWILNVDDAVNQDGGSLLTWGLKVCIAPPANAVDAAILSVDNLEGRFCSQTDFNPEITISNNGSSTLTSADIVYSINGTAPSTYNWTGNLPSTQATSITLPTITASPGPQNFGVTITNPNNTTDGNNSDNTASASFTIVDPGSDIAVEITTDNWGSETTWEITNSFGIALLSGGPYADGAPGTVYTDLDCLPNGCYTFTIFDSYGDGIQDGTNTGNYQVTDSSGTPLVSMTQADFGNSTSHNFCITTVGVEETAQPLNSFVLMPNPNNGNFQLAIDLGVEKASEIYIVNTLGQELKSYTYNQQNIDLNVDMTNYSAGVYFVILRTEDGTISKKVTIKK
jgi:subtilisin-like proprotein convertase family protein